LTWQQDQHDYPGVHLIGLSSMRFLPAFLLWLAAVPAWSQNDLVLPKIDFSATAVQEVGAFMTRETIRYTQGKLRIERGQGFSTTILDLNTQTECVLMVNHTYLVLPMNDGLYKRYVARAVAVTGARKRGTERVDGLATTKYAFGDYGGTNPEGFYWLADNGIMVRREYVDGLFGQNEHHREFLTGITLQKQPAALFVIPAGYKPAT
jgi:hypothetical protein